MKRFPNKVMWRLVAIDMCGQTAFYFPMSIPNLEAKGSKFQLCTFHSSPVNASVGVALVLWWHKNLASLVLKCRLRINSSLISFLVSTSGLVLLRHQTHVLSRFLELSHVTSQTLDSLELIIYKSINNS